MGKNKNFLIFGAAFFLWILTPFFLLSAEAASYKYIDKNGTIHFTDRYESIPQEYRNQVKTLREESEPQSPMTPPELKEKSREVEPGIGEHADKVQKTEQKEAEAIEARKKEVEEKKLKGIEEKERRFEDLKKQLEEKRKQQRSLRTNWMVHDRNAMLKLNQEIAILEKQLQLLQEEISEGK